MIKITSTNDVIIVEGDELTRHYPYNGTLVIPKNSTLVVLDEKSEMVLFKSASNYDTLFTGILGSILIEDEIVTRENIIEKFNAISNVIVGGNVDLFEVVQSLPTENINDNKVYLVLDSNGSEGNTYVEYLYVNGQWEELGKFNVNVDLNGYATEQWVNSQGFLKEHQDISNLATKAELNSKQDTITDLETIRSGAAKGATALQEVPSTYALKTDILSAKTDTRYTTFEVQSPVLSGKTIVLQNEVTDSRKYHTLGFDKTIETTGIGQVQKYVDYNGESDSSGFPIIRTNFDDYENIPLDFSNITDDGDVEIIYYNGSFINMDNGSIGETFYSYITYNKNTKILKASDGTRESLLQFTRSDTGEYIFNEGNTQYDCNKLPDGVYLIWHIYVYSNLFFAFYASTAGKLFVGETTTTTPTSRLPQNKNEFFRYENDVKAYILTDKNTTFKTINGQQILGNGDITIDTNVDLSGYATKTELNAKQDVINDLDTIRSGAAKGATALQSVPSGYATEQWVNGQGFLKEHQDISNLATKDELNAKQDVISDLETIRSGAAKGATALQSVPDTYALKSELPDITTKQDVLVSGTNIKTINGTSLLGSGNIEVAANVDLSNYATKEELNAKQDTLVSGTNIKTINGTSLLGSGDITIEGGSGNVDLSNYYTKTETNELVNPKLSQVTLTQAEYDALSTKENNVLYVISDAEDIKFKTINGQQITGEGNIEIKASADNVPTVQTTPKGTTSNYIYSTGTLDNYGVISDIANFITYSTDKASIKTWKNYWGEESANVHQNWSINGATTSEAGLMSASDKTKLDGIDLSTKQDTLVSGTNIKTVNGTSLLGSGNIELATKAELATKQDVISDLETIRSGAALGATALQSVPDTYALKSEIPDITTKQDTLVSGTNIKTVNGTSLLGSGNIELATKAELATKQDVISDLETIRSGAALGATALQSVPDTYALKSEIPDIATKQDTLVSGTNIKSINGTSLLGSGNIEIAKEWIGTQSEYDALPTKDNNTTYYITG